MPSAPRSKYACDAHLFRAEPPEDLRNIKRLFTGRVSELKQGYEVLRNNRDIGGRRGKSKQPWVIHGETRSGKSHLARRILAQFPKRKSQFRITVHARERLTAEAVLHRVFELMSEEFMRLLHNASIRDQSLRGNPAVNDVIHLITEITPHLRRNVDKIKVSKSRVREKEKETGFSISLKKLITFQQKCSTNLSDSDGFEYEIKRPGSMEVAELCSLMAHVLFDAKLIRHIFILIDDVDLLDANNASTSRRDQRSALSEALIVLNTAPTIDVIITARSWYAHNNKDFTTLVDLATSQFKAGDLVDIYNLRYQHLGPKGGTNDGFLTSEALEELAEDVDRLPGVFLQHLQHMFPHFQREQSWEPRDYLWFLTKYRQRYLELGRKCPAVVERIENAVREERLEIHVAGDNDPIYATAFRNDLVYQSYYGEGTWFMSGVARKVLMLVDTIESM